jgi:CubicO group peptidase (beta-lactamase class C family)
MPARRSAIALAVLRTSLVIAAFSAAPHAHESAPADAWARVVEIYRQRVHDAGIVGSSLLFVRDGMIAGAAVDGYQELATKRVVDDATIFHWASITKTMRCCLTRVCCSRPAPNTATPTRA